MDYLLNVMDDDIVLYVHDGYFLIKVRYYYSYNN